MTSSQLLLSFTVDQLNCVQTLSVFNEKILVGSGYDDVFQLFIYSREGLHLSTPVIKNRDKLNDATWTPRGNIVYTCTTEKYLNNKVVIMSESGNFNTTLTLNADLQTLSVSNDNTIYLTDQDNGVLQSIDDGVSWRPVFQPVDGYRCMKVLKATINQTDHFWSLGFTKDENFQIRVYSVDRRRFNSNMTWSDINTTTGGGKISLPNISLSYDGNMNIFISDHDNKSVHVFLVNGQYHSQLLSSLHIKNNPCKIAVDRNRQLLYVGEEHGVVEVFKLIYG